MVFKEAGYLYNVNDVVVYGNTGVCRVVDIGTPQFHGVDKKQSYYTLKPIFGDGVIYCPVDNNRVFIRPIISKEEAENGRENTGKTYHSRKIHFLEFIKQKATYYKEKSLTYVSKHHTKNKGIGNCNENSRVKFIIGWYAIHPKK